MLRFINTDKRMYRKSVKKMKIDLLPDVLSGKGSRIGEGGAGGGDGAPFPSLNFSVITIVFYN